MPLGLVLASGSPVLFFPFIEAICSERDEFYGAIRKDFIKRVKVGQYGQKFTEYPNCFNLRKAAVNLCTYSEAVLDVLAEVCTFA